MTEIEPVIVPRGASFSDLLKGAGAAATAENYYAKFGKRFTSGEAAQKPFEGALADFFKEMESGSYAKSRFSDDSQENTIGEQPMPQQDAYFSYGKPTGIDEILRSQTTAQSPNAGYMTAKEGGLATPLFAAGGNTRYGYNSGGALPTVAHSGKERVDFRQGDAVTGPGDGQSDDIPAMLADGEFVIPADVVSALGNGSTKAGSDKLYDMMHNIRRTHRAGDHKDLPTPAKKSPLDYIKTKSRR